MPPQAVPHKIRRLLGAESARVVTLRQDASTVLYALFAAYRLQPYTTAAWCRASVLLRNRLADDWRAAEAGVRLVIATKWGVHEDEVERAMRDHARPIEWPALAYLQTWARTNIAVIDVDSGQLLRQDALPLHPKTVVLAASAASGMGVFELDGVVLLDKVPPGLAGGY